MKIKSILSLIALVAAAKVSAISYDASINGTSAPAGSSFSAVGGTIGTKTYGGTTILGVNGVGAGAEIDYTQSLTITFDAAQWVNELQLGLLYNGPEFGDKNEVAIVAVNGAPAAYSLTAATDFTANWVGGPGTVTNLSPAKLNLGGLWKIVNPFGNLKIWSLTFTSAAPKGAAKSDYGIAAFSTTAVRAPDTASTLALAGLAIMGLGFAVRRK